jgi:mannose-6-phosphate isomerase
MTGAGLAFLAGMLTPLRIAPVLRERVWGGQRLDPEGVRSIGEAWVVHGSNRIVGGSLDGRTLDQATAALGERLLGRRGASAAGGRFPLLVKLLDAADWLSVQVHPDDEQAARLEGADQVGKTEAWHILEAAPGARVIAGLRDGTTREALERAIRAGTLLELAGYLDVRPGDTVFNRAGLVHALGPGLLLYEVQQSSDITYRVWDWNRPASPERPLHVEQSLAVVRLDARPEVTRADAAVDGVPLTSCPYFALERFGPGPAALGTPRPSFDALTLVEGAAVLRGDGWSEELGRFESAVVPAEAGAYRIEARGDTYRALVARVP